MGTPNKVPLILGNPHFPWKFVDGVGEPAVRMAIFIALSEYRENPQTGVDYLDNLAPQALEIKHEVLISTHVESFAGLGNHMNLDSKTRE